MADPVLDPAKFRLLFPQFADPALYPDDTLQAWWQIALCSLQEPPCVCLTDACGATLMYLMAAHIGALLTRAATSAATGVITSATIDKVAVGFAAPPFKNGWQFWLASTPYGVQLWAMLSALGAGGFSVNGRPEGRAFRKVYGSFR
jgi:hypothetical protein